MARIQHVKAREILDSRGNPTLETSVSLDDGSIGIASVPSGASTGSHEAKEIRDNDINRYNGKGVLTAVRNINHRLGPSIIGLDGSDQEEIDSVLCAQDGTPTKAILGANAILGVSLGVAKANAHSKGIPLYRSLTFDQPLVLPTPMLNIINGGRHANNSLDFQEFMVVPTGFSNFKEALRCGVEVYHALKIVLEKENLSTAVGDEGGFAPFLNSNEDALKLLTDSISAAGYHPGENCYLALDIAASEIYQDGKYILSEQDSRLSATELISYYADLIKRFPIISIEDGLAQDDWEGWQRLTSTLGGTLQIVGDDLFTTNTSRIQRGIAESSANSVLVKLNQIGSLSETLTAIATTQTAGWNPIVSHRSGDTEDSSISDLAVGTGSGQIKAGGPSRSERVAKYNRLLFIEEEIGNEANYAGITPFVAPR